jgi:hypothetical protein
VTVQPTMTPSDVVLQQVARDMGVGATFRRTPVGVFFGEPGVTVPDLYFSGAGPARTGCIECGDCMIGCRYGGKNRLDLNYPHLADGAGAVIHPGTTVTALRPAPGGWRLGRPAPELRRPTIRTTVGSRPRGHAVPAAGPENATCGTTICLVNDVRARMQSNTYFCGTAAVRA